MLETLKNWLYDIITSSGILLKLLPILQPILMRLAVMKDKSNHKITDDGGATLHVMKINGKIFPAFGVDRMAAIANMTIRKSDVMLCGYPKTGCHWVYEIMYMLVSGKVKLTKHGKEVGGMIDGMPQIILDSQPSPRVLNSHLLYQDLPVQIKTKKTKIVLTVRNPKDTVVSFYNHTLKISELYRYHGDFHDYFKLFMAGTIDYESYFDHILAWEKAMRSQKDNPILMVEYEDLKADPVPVVKRIAEFLDISITEQVAKDILQECDFHKMKKERSGDLAGHLFRKGQVGDWRNWLTEEESGQIDKVWKEKMAGCSYQPQL